MILTFHVGVVSALLFLFNYLLNPMLSTNLLFNLSVYGGTISVISLTLFVPLFLLNEIYLEFNFDTKLNRNIIYDISNGVSVLVLLFTGHIINKFGIEHEQLFDEVYQYLAGLVWG